MKTKNGMTGENSSDNTTNQTFYNVLQISLYFYDINYENNLIFAYIYYQCHYYYFSLYVSVLCIVSLYYVICYYLPSSLTESFVPLQLRQAYLHSLTHTYTYTRTYMETNGKFSGIFDFLTTEKITRLKLN